MNYHLTIDGDSSSIASFFNEVEEKGASLFQDRNSEKTYNFLISKTKTNSHRIIIELTTFAEITSHIISSVKQISVNFDNLIFRIQFIEGVKEIVGGYQIEKGSVSASFMYEDTCVMCDIIEDYLCSLHLSNRHKSSISTDGFLLSELISSNDFKIGNISYLQEKRLIHFFDGETLYFNIEYSDCQDSNDKIDPGYQTFGLSDFSWSIQDQEGEGILYDLITGSIPKNFFHIVGFRFASEVAIDNDMQGLKLVV